LPLCLLSLCLTVYNAVKTYGERRYSSMHSYCIQISFRRLRSSSVIQTSKITVSQPKFRIHFCSPMRVILGAVVSLFCESV
jgi:hypothetical protein